VPTFPEAMIREAPVWGKTRCPLPRRVIWCDLNQ
jgi:hypothetical protein